MKTSLLSLTLAIFLYCCQSTANRTLSSKSASPAFSDTIDIDSDEYQQYHQLVQHFLDSTLFKTRFNGQILVAKNGNIVYEAYIGYKDFRTKDTLTSNTPFQIASVSKTFTSAAILRLIQEGKLQLDDPLYKFFPGFPYAGVTVKMLLNHRSGLPNYLYYLEKGGWDKKTFVTNADVLNTLMRWQPQQAFKANTHFNYCNTNYVLLALIVEKVTGIPFPQYMKENFFDPLHMNNTFILTLNDTAGVANSFNAYGRIWERDFTDGPYGDKNVYSTARDLLKWDQAFYDETILKKQILDSAYTPYSNEKRSLHNYGLGWRLLIFPNGKKVIYHNGRWHGFNAAFSRLADEKVTIIILGNKYNSSIYRVARDMYNLFGDYKKDGDIDLEELGNRNKP
ncbi:MAG: beta-lactamase family protein [Chitinophagaceae bacterium]|nr:beta-lactamase family protein [Chitinophagaceae bacterium]